MESNFFKYYIYAHFNSEGKLFYIGKGSGNRAYMRYGRNKCWYEQAKDGFSVEILFDNLSNTKALILEEVCIGRIKINNLCNMKNKSTIFHHF
jgi:hypothetical protein